MRFNSRKLTAAVFATALAFGGVACDDDDAEDVGNEVEEGAEDLGNEVEEGAENLEEEVDGGGE